MVIETGINIKYVCIPATLIALDCSRKVGCHDSLKRLILINKYIRKFSNSIKNKRILISLRITGESAAIQIKNYIESHSYLENTDIILLVISDHEYLLRKVNQIQKNKGLCVR